MIRLSGQGDVFPSPHTAFQGPTHSQSVSVFSQTRVLILQNLSSDESLSDPCKQRASSRSSCSPLHFRKMLRQRALGAATLVVSKTGRHSGLPLRGGIWLHPNPNYPPPPLHPSPTSPARPHQQQSLGNIISQTSQTSLGNISPTPAVSPTEVQAGEAGRGLPRYAVSTQARDNQPNPGRLGAPTATATTGLQFLKTV